jgi:hypothetical protein
VSSEEKYYPQKNAKVTKEEIGTPRAKVALSFRPKGEIFLGSIAIAALSGYLAL